ncbi:3-ketoacyl-acyl carrier protein reductase [Neofusicoccum parvum]|nr:3-ketoacyl-acyl carrier protein reductase [Neofusicoccum parvum]
MTAQTLSGKVAIVTGGTRGIGAAIVLELARRGAKVAFTYVSPSSAALAADLTTTVSALPNGTTAHAIQADMASPSAPATIVAATTAIFGPTIDILVHNAGIYGIAPLAAITPASYTTLLDTNVRGVLFLTQAVAPHLPAAGGGRVIAIGSIAARSATPGAAVYAASKAALEAMTRAFAAELGPAGHTANVVAPGPTATDIIKRETGASDAVRAFVDKAVESTPMQGRIGTGEDVAGVVAAVAEPGMGWVTGQSLSASGGLVMF